MKCTVLLFTGFCLVSSVPRVRSGPVRRGVLPAMPQPCIDKHFCVHKHQDYPQELIDGLLQEYKVSLGDQFEPSGKRSSDEFDSETQEDCQKSRVDQYSQIYEVSVNNEVRVVVQGSNFWQQVRIEKCRNPGRLLQMTKHFTNEEDLKNNFINCEETTMNYNFLVLDHTGSKLETVPVELPVYCACRLRQK